MTEEKKVKFEDISIDLIDTGPWQSRSRRVEENTDELAENIRCLGLINPIMVYQKPDGRFELIAGQRRLMAIEKLGWKTVRAQILLYKPTDIEAKAISLSENIFREKLVLSDVKDSIMLLYYRCGASATTISKTTGIPYWFVLEVIKYEALPDELKKMVDEGQVDVEIAAKAARFATPPSGSVDVKKAVRLAPELKILMPSQAKTLGKIAKESPTLSAEELLEKAKGAVATKRIVIEILIDEYEALRKAADAKGVDEREVAYMGLVAWLKEEGFLP